MPSFTPGQQRQLPTSPNGIPNGRPSVNLGHINNAQINSVPKLPSFINPSNPIPYSIIKQVAPSNLGTRVSTAAQAARTTPLAGTTVGNRVSAAVKALVVNGGTAGKSNVASQALMNVGRRLHYDTAGRSTLVSDIAARIRGARGRWPT